MSGQLLLFITALIISWLLTFPAIVIARFFKFSQAIREEVPPSHQSKSGTLTAGGVGLVLTIIILSLIFIDFHLDGRYLTLIFLMAGFALIGLLDDLIKIIRHNNLGLTFRQKIITQTMLALVFSAYLVSLGQAHALFYLLFYTFIIVGSANGTNLTDGLNGLLAGTAGIAFLSLAFLANKLDLADAASFALIAAGASLAFLRFNFPKAKIFMGDVGSLAIGAALGGLAIIMHQELTLIVIGGIFVIEALSVILQVGSYKLWKRRIFKMTPLHHHFELLGFKETTIVVSFWVIGIVLGILGIILSSSRVCG